MQNATGHNGVYGHGEVSDGSHALMVPSLLTGIDSATGIRSVPPSSIGVVARGGHAIGPSDNQEQQQHLRQNLIGPHDTRVGIGCYGHYQVSDGSQVLMAAALAPGIAATTGIRGASPSLASPPACPAINSGTTSVDRLTRWHRALKATSER